MGPRNGCRNVIVTVLVTYIVTVVVTIIVTYTVTVIVTFIVTMRRFVVFVGFFASRRRGRLIAITSAAGTRGSESALPALSFFCEARNTSSHRTRW